MLKPIKLMEIPRPITMFNEVNRPSKTIIIPSWITLDIANRTNLENEVFLYYYGASNLARKDKRRAKKYKIEYRSMVCIWTPGDDPKGYNAIILKKLEEKYGSKVLKKVRKDLY
jgi:hypothetical protein